MPAIFSIGHIQIAFASPPDCISGKTSCAGIIMFSAASMMFCISVIVES